MIRWTGNPAVHSFFEIVGYVAAVLVYIAVRRRRGDAVADETRAAVFAGAAAGALIGSRLLVWPSGKTIVGGLAGGLIGVELAKRILGVKRSTGDLFVLPLIVAMTIGRIGCFLTGAVDHTEGNPTTLPWGIAIGDPVKRHPVALYEIAFLLLLIPLTEWIRRRSETLCGAGNPAGDPASHAGKIAGATQKQGDAFATFLASYFAFRLLVDFIKPDPPPVFLHLSTIQWACVAGLIYYALVFSNDERSAAVPLLRRRRVDLPDVLPQD